MCSFTTDDDGADTARASFNGDRCVPIRHRFRIGKSRIPGTGDVPGSLSVSSERKKSVSMGADRDYR